MRSRVAVEELTRLPSGTRTSIGVGPVALIVIVTFPDDGPDGLPPQVAP